MRLDKGIKMASYTGVVDCVINDLSFELDNGKEIRLDNVMMTDPSAATYYLHCLIEGEKVRIEETRTSGKRVRARVWRFQDNLFVNQAMVDEGHTRWCDSS